MPGPLAGLKVLEIAALGPAPFAGMLLADMGAEVLRIDRPGGGGVKPVSGRFDVTSRGRTSVRMDLRTPDGVEACLGLIEAADVLTEGFRPGVMERLGLGPEPALARNPRLVYGRMTGWGQDGPLAQAAGHDINYVALSGALHAIGPADRPAPPLNLVGDYGGGALYLAVGVLAAVISARATGRGQVVDAAMTDGAASLMSVFYGLHAAGVWRPEREANFLDGAAPFYGAYQCADGEWISLGPLEPQFFDALLERLQIDPEPFARRMNPATWPDLRARIAAVVATRTREQWREALEGSDVCFAPVLNLADAPTHPHNAARGTFIEVDGVTQPAPAPRFSGTPCPAPSAPPREGEHGADALVAWGLDRALAERAALPA